MTTKDGKDNSLLGTPFIYHTSELSKMNQTIHNLQPRAWVQGWSSAVLAIAIPHPFAATSLMRPFHFFIVELVPQLAYSIGNSLSSNPMFECNPPRPP